MASSGRVLLVDDEEDIRTIGAFALREVGGWVVESVGSGTEAIDRARSGEFEVILLDVMMPGMGGLETMDGLRALPGGSPAPVIFMTANVHPEDVASYLERGAIGVVEKPFDPIGLGAELRRILDETAG